MPSSAAVSPVSGAAPQPAAAQAPLTRLPIATIGAGSTADAGFALAAGLGYLQEERLEMDNVRMANASILVPAMQRGDIPVAGMGFNSALLSTLGQGALEARIVADKGSLYQTGGGAVLLVRKDLIDSQRVRTLADLRGMRVALNQRGGVLNYYLDLALQRDGAAFADIQPLLINFGEQLPALESGQIDAGMNVEPNGTVAESRGIAVIFRTGVDLVPDGQSSQLVMMSDWLTRERGQAVGFLRAYIRAARDYNDWLAAGQPNDRIAVLLADWAQAASGPELITRSLAYGLRPDVSLNVADMQRGADWFHQQGFLDAPVQVSAHVDDSPRLEALASLPAYTPPTITPRRR